MVSNIIQEKIHEAITNIYQIDAPKFVIEHPNVESLGDYATNVALILAKSVKQNPFEIAKSLCYELQSMDIQFSVDGLDDEKFNMFKEIYPAQPGFINFKLSNEWLYYVLSKILKNDSNYGVMDLGGQKRVALEHSNVNPNKAAHVGHLRNACIGQFLEHIYEKINYDVEVQYLDNDLGVQVSTSLMGTKRIKNISPEDYDKYDHYAWDVYTAMETLISENQELEKERQEIMQQLEDPSNPIAVEQVDLSERILYEQLRTFQSLGFDYDVVIRERDVVSLKLWETAFEKLKNNDNVYLADEGPSKGCWLVRLNSDKAKNSNNSEIEEDKIIVRSNGVPTYTGKDIAYHMWKFGLLGKDFYYRLYDRDTQDKDLYITTSDESKSISGISFSNVDLVLNVIDVKQTYAIDVVKQSLRYLGYEEEAQNMVHINYGFVYLSAKTAEQLGIDTSDGKAQYGMSGRKGWGIKIDDFVKMVDDALVSQHGSFEALPHVRNGAIKFEMLKRNTFKDLVFDLDEALNINGYSGPYLQYTHARANSVLSKSSEEPNTELYIYDITNLPTVLEPKELSVLRELYKYPEVVSYAASQYAPNLLCEYLFSLAQSFNTFYNDCPILSANNKNTKNFRLLLTQSVRLVLKDGLELLGIEAPEKI